MKEPIPSNVGFHLYVKQLASACPCLDLLAFFQFDVNVIRELKHQLNFIIATKGMASGQVHRLPWSPGNDGAFYTDAKRQYFLSGRKWNGRVTLPPRNAVSSEEKPNDVSSKWAVEDRGDMDVFRLVDSKGSCPVPDVPVPGPVQTLKPHYSLYRVIMTHDYGSGCEAPTRGLYNTNNMCFFNSVLQALVHCAPFYDLFRDIYANTSLSIKSSTPILDSLVLFAHSYGSVGISKPMSAEEFYSVICAHPKFHVQRDRQEDAQEFLAYLLDELESNFANAKPSEEDLKDNLKAVRHEATPDYEAEDEWMEVGKGSKTVQTQHAGQQDLDNPIQELFGGRLRSVLLKKGNRQPSITTEPFLQVPLDISGSEVTSIQTALDGMLQEEHLMLGSIPATKRLEFERMPPILIIHLKRFSFINLGDTFDFGKITKPIIVDDSLRVACGFDEAVYTPFAIVYHHGPTATRGHYTTEVLADSVWHHIDDDQLTSNWLASGSGHSIADEDSKAVYMVFYERKRNQF